MPFSKNYSSIESGLVGNLEEFGLSKYEARAYITLVEKGMLGASELAYYSNLPRTKIYSTLKKLEKKGLLLMSNHKPLIASAVKPEEAFIEIISLHERRLKNMKKIISGLGKIEARKKIFGTEEKKYTVIDPRFVDQKVSDLILASKSVINAMLDSWGLNLLSRCGDALKSATSKGVTIKLLIGSQCLDNTYLHSLPKGLDIRLHTFCNSALAIDSSKIISIDSTNGKAVVTSSIDIVGDLHQRLFEERWEKALKVNSLIGLDHQMLVNALRLKRIVEEKLSDQISQDMARANSDLPHSPERILTRNLM
jgi:HTH-type transcriptional regulator, sugar sensing transcriptional regulator